MHILLELFLSFFKIGLFTFGGGYAMISLVNQTCIEKGWLTENEILSLTNQGKLSVDYIGSYMVNSKDLDLTTPEGVDVYIELFGDGYVQCVDGKDIKDYTK